MTSTAVCLCTRPLKNPPNPSTSASKHGERERNPCPHGRVAYQRALPAKHTWIVCQRAQMGSQSARNTSTNHGKRKRSPCSERDVSAHQRVLHALKGSHGHQAKESESETLANRDVSAHQRALPELSVSHTAVNTRAQTKKRKRNSAHIAVHQLDASINRRGACIR